ncbi:MAG: RluA family pseudouridine synthase [Helicobacter sp.]|nr:RluA family pseudouridine synthase [Helicobacter sp.]
MQKNKIKIICENLNNPLRLDIYLTNALNLSRSQVLKSIEKGEILLNNAIISKGGILIKNGDCIELIHSQKQLESQQKSLEIPTIYEDEYLLILNKPSDLIVHKANQNDTQFSLAEWLKEKNYPLSNLGDSNRAGIIHRLDKGTSGVIVIAKDNKTHLHLSTQLKERTMGRYYLCVLDAPLKKPQIIDSPIIRHPKLRLKYITANKNNTEAKPAKTAFFNIDSTKNLALIGAKLFSGRTHQIRVHLNTLNRHILGDGFYGYKGDFKDRILLHAHLLYLTHPISQKPLRIYAPIPQIMQEFLEKNFTIESYKTKGEILIPLDTLYLNSFASC